MNPSPLTALQLKQLSADLNPKRIAQRSQGGANSNKPKLSYLEAWDVRAALTRIFGYGGYSYESETRILKVEEGVASRSNSNATNFRFTAMSTVKLYIPVLGAFYQESAVSSQSQPDPGECADFAVKTAESDALKRCAVNLGTQFGLSLYNKGGTADVIKIVREPAQAAILARLQQGELASTIDADLAAKKEGGEDLRRQPVDLDEPTDADRTYGYDPDHGDTGVEGGDGEAVDTPMYQREADPARTASARDALRNTFDRKQES